MASPKISIVTPSFNQAAWVEKTVRSVLDQNYDNLEYIVVDGASTDGSVGILKKYSDRFHYFVSERDSGHASALNKGFRQSSGEIMGWLNSDDMYLPWTLRTVAELFEGHPEVNWISGIPAMWTIDDVLVPANLPFKNQFDYLAGKFEWIQQESVFWRRRLWDKAGGRIDESYKFMVDGELWTRFFCLDHLWYANCFLGGYRMHATNRAHQFQQECQTEMRNAIEAMRRKLDTTQLGDAKTHYPILYFDHKASRWIKWRTPRSA